MPNSYHLNYVIPNPVLSLFNVSSAISRFAGQFSRFTMTNANKQRDLDEHGGSDGETVDDFSLTDDANGAETSGFDSTNGSRSEEIGFSERLADILVDETDGDLRIQQNDGRVRVLQWLQALDTQYIGACRVDERLKPLLKLTVSNDAAEERLVAHLSQHFESSETGMLARCLCIPLVSIRVGKNIKQGKRLIPIDERGSLNLFLLPTSELQLAFVGDDGNAERLCTLSSSSQCSAVLVEEISADTSGRSFLVKIPDHKVSYFWCSEKSLLLGKELLAKIKDLLMRKPSLAELTGINEARLECFGAHLRAYFLGSAVSKTQTSSGCSSAATEARQNAPFLFHCSNPTMRYRQTSSHSVKTNSIHQGSLSPRSSSFKEGLPKTLVSLRSTVREKLRRRGDNLITMDDLPIRYSIAADTSTENFKTQVIPPLQFLESLGKSVPMTPLSSVPLVTPLGSSLLSPYYCWCPFRGSNLQYTVPSSQLPNEALSLQPPPFLPATGRSSSPLNTTNVTSLGLPNFLPDSFLQLPFSTPSSHQMMQIPTFTPLMCDTIVHIPVIDVCSSGQGYLVSAGPDMSTSIPSLQSQLTNPLSRSTDSTAENGARETLRMLINGTNQTNSQLMNVVFPTVLTSSQENQSLLLAGTLAGSRGLYSSTGDVDAIASSIAALGLVSLSGTSLKDCFGRCSCKEDFGPLSKHKGAYDFGSDLSSDSSDSGEKSED